MQQEWDEQIAAFGLWLTDYLGGMPQYCHYLVYCGCGPSGPSLAQAGRGVRGLAEVESRLADVDLMVAEPNRDVVVLVQVERGALSQKDPGSYFRHSHVQSACIGTGWRRPALLFYESQD